jgi:N utilization substance protein B
MSARAPRHRGRELALRALYQADVLNETRADALTQILEDPAPRDPDEIAALAETLPEGEEPRPESLDPSLVEFVTRLVRLVDEHAVEIDETIESAAQNWRLARMATVDRNVLRLGVAELLYRPDVPVGVAINEAILLAKRYGGKDSSAFVNALLDRVASKAKSGQSSPDAR